MEKLETCKAFCFELYRKSYTLLKHSDRGLMWLLETRVRPLGFDSLKTRHRIIPKAAHAQTFDRCVVLNTLILSAYSLKFSSASPCSRAPLITRDSLLFASPNRNDRCP